MITDLASLKAAINSKTERSFTDDELGQFIGLAEAGIRRKLTGYQREIATTLTTDGAGFADLPSDFIGFVGISLAGQRYRYSVGGSEVYVANGPSRTLNAVYYGRLPSLSDANPTNWLLDLAPDVYFMLTEAQARSHMEEWQVAAGLKAEGMEMLADLNLQNTVAQYGRAGMNLPVQAF